MKMAKHRNSLAAHANANVNVNLIAHTRLKLRQTLAPPPLFLSSTAFGSAAAAFAVTALWGKLVCQS